MTVISALSVLPGWLSTACHLLVSPDSGLYTINYHGMFGEDSTVLLAGEHKSDWRGPGPPGKSVPWLWLEPDFFYVFIQASLVLILLCVHCKGLIERVTQ